MSETDKDQEPLPEQFDNFDGVADFWDTHDVTAYADQLTPVEFEVAPQPTREYVITLSDSLNKRVREMEKREGIKLGTLVNLWVQEKLQERSAG
jgi:hypothetical protein